MSLFRPKSFLVLVLIGFSVVLTPLLIALISAQVSVRGMVDQGTETVYRSVSATEGGRVLVERLVDLERSARQYQVLKEPALLEDVAHKRDDVLTRIENLAVQADPSQHGVLESLREGVDALTAELISAAGNGERSVSDLDLDEFVRLNAMAKTVYFNSYDLIVREVDSLHARASKVQNLLIWTSLGLLPLTLLLVAFFVRRLSRPVQQINKKIMRLGEGDFSTEISVGGPQDLRDLGQRLDWLRQRLGEVEREKHRFLAHVSHELKTPLASIREGSELLIEQVGGPLTKQQREIARILGKNSVQLQKMIENLLGFSRNPTRSIRSETKVDLQEMIKALLQDHRAVVLKKNLQIKTRLRPGELTVDRDRLRTVLDNLLSNAVKYTPSGGRVEVAVRSADDETLIDVSDSGPGVDETEKKKIFEPFFQGSAPCLGPVQGTGLGLSIAKEYVDGLNGRIELEKSTYGGALFRLHLPMKMETPHE